MTSLEYADEISAKHWNLMRVINNYMRYLKASIFDETDYFTEDYYKSENGVKYKMYNIKEKGLKLLKSKVPCNVVVDHCAVEYENQILPIWVYRNLRNFGNCAISCGMLEELGEDKLLQNLKENGFDCDIRVEHKTLVEKYMLEKKEFKMDYCILTVKEREKCICMKKN